MSSKRGRGFRKPARLAAAVARPRVPTPQELERFGVRPEAPAELFVVQGRGVYRVRQEQIVSLRPCRSGVDPEQARSYQGRQPLVVNAGTPTEANPQAGRSFHGHAFTPKPEETHESEWWDPKNAESAGATTQGVDPKTLERFVSSHRYCSPADVLARYAGGAALLPTGAALFQILFLNEGRADFASRPPEGATEETGRPWLAQRNTIAGNLCKLFLLCPQEDVHPELAKDGTPRRVLPAPDREAGRDDFACPVTMLACLATIVSDKSQGAPGAAHQTSIGGYHDRCRLHLLSMAHVKKLQQLVRHFDLETHFPMLVRPELSWHADKPLEQWRAQAVRELGPAPGASPPDEWLRKRSQLNLGVPWVAHCAMASPGGAVDNDGRPALVPLVCDGAEERNGSAWLHLRDEDAVTAHHAQVTSALARVAGRAPRASPSALPTADAAEEACLLREELKVARQHIADLAADCNRLRALLGWPTDEKHIAGALED
jgi:hypothetical protein